MPFASIGYPFADNSVGDDGNPKNFPADFIVEYVAQTRGWFYTMMVLSTALFDKAPFKNCICHGVILDANGQKLSKRLKNYPDPMEVFDKISSDAMRWFVVSSPVMNGGDLLVDKDAAAIKDVIRLVIKPIYNSYTFFAMYANADKITAQEDYSSQNVMDIYILSKLKTLSLTVAKSMDSYSTQPACAAIVEFMEILNNWYIRRTKERFWKSEKDQDKALAYNTLYTVLLNICKISSPLLPHLTEEIYLNLTQHI
jgi:isoleucyl-tRNA synthetase